MFIYREAEVLKFFCCPPFVWTKQISNLMGGDAYQVAERFWWFSGVVTSPLKLILSLLFLYQLSLQHITPTFFMHITPNSFIFNFFQRYISLIFDLHKLFSLLGVSAILGSAMVGLAYLLNWPLIKFDVMVRELVIFAFTNSTFSDSHNPRVQNLITCIHCQLFATVH